MPSIVKDFINEVEFEEALVELGGAGMYELAELFAWLEKEHATEKLVLSRKRRKTFKREWCARFAPSIVSRGIAELFEVSIPRFALRVYANHGRTSFVNALRIGTLANQATWRRAGQSRREIVVKGDRSMADVIRKSTFCVADSILNVPRRFANYSIIKEWYGREYGEEQSVQGVPYVRNIELNGLCAQATCFMATALLHRITHNTPGITEITRMAQNDRGHILLYGLTSEQMRDYFEKVHLRASLQSSGPSVLYHRAGPLPLYARSVAAYLRSKCPVILPVDSGRMARLGEADRNRQSIFGLNGLSSDRISDRTTQRPRRHVVLAVGFKCHQNDKETEIVFQDSSRFPFMVATAEMLAEAKCWWGPSPTPTEDTSVDHQFIPITPSEVKLGLGSELDRSSARTPKHFGVFAFHEKLNFLCQSDPECSDWVTEDPGSLLLCRPEKDQAAVIDFLEADQNFGLSKAKAIELASKWAGEFKSHWIWIQAFAQKKMYFIWDATFEMEGVGDFATLQRVLLSAHKYHLGFWEPLPIHHRAPAFQPIPSTLPDWGLDRLDDRDESGKLPVPTTLRTAVITSFCAGGIHSAARWPNIKGWDLYCFMQPDARRFFPRDWSIHRQELRNRLRHHGPLYLRNIFRTMLPAHLSHGRIKLKFRPALAMGSTKLGVTVHLAKLCRNEAAIDRLAGELKARFAGKGGIVSFSSYIPEVASHIDNQHTNGVEALLTLAKLARRLHDGKSNRPFAIEIVGGTLVQSIYERDRTHRPGDRLRESFPTAWKETTYMAYLREPSEARKKLLDGLKKMFAELDQTGPSNLVIAIEMEPGPLYSLADGGDIEDFASEIKDYCEGQPELGRRIGLNLDIAHWGFLAKLSPDWVRERPQVFKRVVHAHVSDHASGGHFGDVVPLRLHEENEFADWLTLLEEIDAAKSNGNQDESTPPFSGIISGELEACLCLEQVAEMARAIGAH